MGTGPPTKVLLSITYLLTGSIATRAREPTTRRGKTYRNFGTAGPAGATDGRKSLRRREMRLVWDPSHAQRCVSILRRTCELSTVNC
jgi:hypothetical protein